MGAHKQIVSGVYIGAALVNPFAGEALRALGDTTRAKGSVSNQTVAQLCHVKKHADSCLGMYIDTTAICQLWTSQAITRRR
jgi:hypothetical protein